jgi:serine phosphatase RsbU (regulator of sigma subunit)
MSNSGLPYPIHCAAEQCGQIELPGVPLGSFAGVTYDEIMIPLVRGDVFVLCTDGIFETMDPDNVEFGARRACEVVREHRAGTARGIVDALFEATSRFRGHAPPNDDMTAVAVKITG